ncbi:MAG: hypothetical protein ACRCYZ_05240 [Alphaproteobacteria bacterium]
MGSIFKRTRLKGGPSSVLVLEGCERRHKITEPLLCLGEVLHINPLPFESQVLFTNAGLL